MYTVLAILLALLAIAMLIGSLMERRNPDKRLDVHGGYVAAGCFGAAAAICLIASIPGYIHSRTPEGKAQAAREAEQQARKDMQWSAWVEAEDVVRSRLKAPRTARFSRCDPETSVRVYPGNKCVVCGFGDAENSFGAMLRIPWTVRVRGKLIREPDKLPEWQWELLDVQVEE